MKIIHCIPIEKNANVETLSYFSQKEIPANSVILVPLRGKLTHAVAVSSNEISEIKSVLRKNPYSLKKVARLVAPNFFSESFIKSAKQTGDFFAVTGGAVLSVLTSTKIIFTPKSAPTLKTKTNTEKSIIQMTDPDRFTQYKSILRQSFSKKISVTALVPTVIDGEKLKSNVGKGIEKYSFFFHGGIGKKQMASDYKKMSSTNHPVFFISTGGHLALMPKDTGIILVERESSAAYKTQSRPFVDFRYFAERLAENENIPIIFGDELLTLENRYRLKEESLEGRATGQMRSHANAETKVIDMRNYKPTITGKYSALSEELLTALATARNSNDHSFVYATRKGLYPNTVCGDCGSILRCKICEAALVLHKDRIGTGKTYICHRCGEKRDSHTRCDECDSWKLVTLGVGSEKITEELEKFFPNAKVFRMDREIAKNRRAASKIMLDFYNSPGSILVGTEFAIPYLNHGSTAIGAIASLDSLFSLPEYSINEKIMRTITRIKSISSKKFILQTRHAESAIIKHGAEGNLEAFYKEELALRKKYEYPPFSLFVKITARGNPAKIIEEMKKLEQVLMPQKMHVFQNRVLLKGKHSEIRGLLKINPSNWPIKETVKILKSLPPYFAVNVEPESLM